MTKEEHIKQHEELHRWLYELVVDFIGHTEKLPSKTTVLELIKRSHSQTTEPTSKELEK